MTQTSYSSISPRTNAYADREALKHAQPVIVLGKFGQPKPLPKNKTDTIKFRRPVPWSAATVPLVEGITPTPVAVSYEDVTATLSQYGNVVEITDKVADTHEDPVIKEQSELAGENAGLTIEMITWGVVKAGTNVFYANGSARASVNTPISKSKQRAVTRSLKANKAMKIAKVVSGSPNYDTTPVEPAYVAVGHTDLESDIRNLDGFVPCSKYASMTKVSEHEIGSVEDVRYVLSPELTAFADAGAATSTMVSTTGSNADVYPILYFGRDAFGTVPLKGKGAMEMTLINPDVKTKDDPLGQRGYVGWKAWYTAVILNNTWMARLEVAATDL